MSNPTSNFNWQMPTATDLVTDLPADFEVFGQAVDTSLADLKGGTTNQVLAKNSNTDMDFKWVTDATGMTNPMTTTGDTIYSSSGSTPARLGIGTAGQVLRVNSGATAPEWATPATGALTLITTATAANTAVSLSINSCFSATYTSYLVIVNLKTSGNTNGYFRVRASGTDSTTGYYFSGIMVRSDSTTVTGKAGANQSDFMFGDIGSELSTYQFVVSNPFTATDTNILSNGSQAWISAGNTEMTIINGQHHVATSYDGLTIASDSNLTGTVRVYGYSNS
jgi:hypothetical protein